MKVARWVTFALAGILLSGAAEPVGKDRKVLAPIIYENLALFPVVSTAKTEDRDYLVLDEGMKKKLVEIHEKGDGVVSELTLENKSDKPLFLMAGEVIIGGKQDRIIGRNTIIAAKTKRAETIHRKGKGGKKSTSVKDAMDDEDAVPVYELTL